MMRLNPIPWLLLACVLAAACAHAGEPQPVELMAELEDLKVPAETVWALEQQWWRELQAQEPPQTPPDAERIKFRRHASERELEQQLLLRYVRKNEVRADEGKVEERLKNIRDGLARSGRSYDDYLRSMGKSAEEHRALLAAQVAMEMRLAEHVTGEELQELFAAAKDRLPLRRCSHILIMHRGSVAAAREGVTRSPAEARTRAEEALAKLNGGADFAEVAKAYSDCPSKSKGGDLGYFGKRDAQAPLVPAFADACYALEAPGARSAIFETDFGFHIAKLVEMKTFADFEPVLKQQAVAERVAQFLQQLSFHQMQRATFYEDVLNRRPPWDRPAETPPKEAP